MKLNMKTAAFFLGLALTVPASAMMIEYGLKVGTKAPTIHQNDIKEVAFDLTTAEASGPVVLVFYRGGWCPFCNLQLHDLQTQLVPFAKKNHAQIVAMSVDKATEEAITQAKHDLTMTILSNPDATILGAYHVQNHVSQADYEKQKAEYHLDIEKYSGQTHHIIAVPAVFVVDTQNTIVYAHADSNFKVRAPVSEIKKAILQAEK